MDITITIDIDISVWQLHGILSVAFVRLSQKQQKVYIEMAVPLSP